MQPITTHPVAARISALFAPISGQGVGSARRMPPVEPTSASGNRTVPTAYAPPITESSPEWPALDMMMKLSR